MASERTGRDRGPAGSPHALQYLAVAAVVAGAHLAVFPRLSSLDAFYHMGHAAHFLEAGPFDVAFPWATQSVIGAIGADLWWGLHVVLMPFALVGDPALGAVVAAVVFTAALAATVAWFFGRLGLAGAGWWTALFLVAVPNVLYRYSMVRPHVLSLAAALALLAFLIRGRAWQVGLAAAAITWLHLSLFWMAPGILTAWLMARVIAGRGGGRSGAPASLRPLAAVFAVLAGSLAGWLLRPNPGGAAELAWIQIVELFAEKGGDQPIPFATELQPLPAGELVRTSWLFLTAWLAAASWAVRRLVRSSRAPSDPVADSAASPVADPVATDAEHRVLVGTTLLCSGAFFVLTLASARRAQVEWVAFGFLLLPLAWQSARGWAHRRVLVGVAVAALAVHLPWAAYRHTVNARQVAFPPDLLRGAALWLEANSAPGDVVFHAKWDNFGPLFARNRTNHYLSGMDPIFFFRHDEARYWEFFFLSSDAVTEYTCDAFPCAAGVATSTHTALRDHFGARWVVVEPQRNPRLAAFLRVTPGFALGVDTGREIVFEVLASVPDEAAR